LDENTGIHALMPIDIYQQRKNQNKKNGQTQHPLKKKQRHDCNSEANEVNIRQLFSPFKLHATQLLTKDIFNILIIR
jgi:hypothetical protein